MMYQWVILGVLALAVAGLLTLGLRSRARQNEYLGTGVGQDLSAPSPERLRAEAKLAEIAGRSETVAAPPEESIAEQMPEAQPAPEAAPEPPAAPIPLANPWAATQPAVQPSSDEPVDRITGAEQIESDYDDAELMLREVKAMLLQGRPDRAIAHIRAATGVDYDHAAEFVADVQSRVIG
jgi:hypothetical protein